MRISAFFALLFVAFAWSFETTEDSKSRFSFRDAVADVSPVSCEEGGYRLYPENAFYKQGSDVPYRAYRIAIPANAKPSVTVTDSVASRFEKSWCIADTLKNVGVETSSPILRDGVWVVDVLVPLLRVSGSVVTVRQNFNVKVSFSGSPQNRNPGKRLLSSVLNPKGAASFGTSSSGASRALRKAAVSELSEMTWLSRIRVGDRENGNTAEDGLYAVTYSQVLSACKDVSRSSDCEGIPIGKIRLYGAPQDTMPDVIWNSSIILPNRLFEIPLDIRDHSPGSLTADGTFDAGDTIFFVAYGTSMWKRCDLEDSTVNYGEMQYYYSSSPYSFYQYFQLGWNASGTGMRLSTLSSPSSGSEQGILRYVRVEKDLLLRDTFFGDDGGWEESTGKEWFWFWNAPSDSLSVSSSSFYTTRDATLPDRISDGKSYISLSYYPHRSTYSSSLSNGIKQTSNMTFSDSAYGTRMKNIHFSFSVNGTAYTSYDRLLPGGNFQINSSALKNSGNTYELKMLPNSLYFDRFDGFSIAYAWNPALENDTAEWILPGRVGGKIKIPVSSGSDTKVIKFKNFEPTGLLPVSNGYLYDSVSLGEDTRYLIYKTTSFRKPASIEGVPPRISGVLADISRISSQTEYLIIAPEAFQTPAVALAEFRAGGKARVTYKVAVVLAEDIYRAYSGGSLDPVAIRNYIAYARGVSPNLSNVLLAGDGNFDYRNFHSGFKENRIPPFEKEDAVVEDFFAVLDSGEQVLHGTYDLDLNVGRLPLASVADFEAYNTKIEEHEKIAVEDNSQWRNSLILSADDAWTGSSADGIDHTTPAEDIATTLTGLAENENYHLDIKKIYLLNYAADAAGQKPEAASDLIDRIDQGALFTIYFGHGSISDWAYEGLMKPSYVSDLSNESRYTVLGSFSCTVGRFDTGDETSLSETFIQASKKGAIASIGATRETFGSFNRTFAKSFLTNALFPSGGTLGFVYRTAKGLTMSASRSQRYNNERYALLGEPVVAMPSAGLSLKLDQKVDTIRALDSMTLSGSVSGVSDGTIHVSILEQRYGKKLSREPASSDSVDVLYDGSQIFSEDAKIQDGTFSIDFITPRKISFGDTAAEIRFWAYTSENGLVGRSLVSSIAISGTSPYADSIIANDSVPPAISVQSCLSPASGTAFSEGESVTLASPACLLVTITDSTAIDFREEADEGVFFEVLGQTASASPFHPWPYAEQESKRAVARMTFGASKYPAGLYTFRVTAMDIVGNTASRTVKVNITDGLSEGISDVFTAPNPMKRHGTTFYFKDLAVGRSADVTIFIYNQNGRLVQRIPNAVSGETTWDGRDFYGRKLANGLYHYIVVSKVAASDGNSAKTFRKKQKLVISR